MPSAPFVVPPLLLIVVLLVSGSAKLRDPRDAVSVFVKLELPRFLIRLKAPTLLPYGELTLAGLLLLAPGPAYLGAATLTMLLFLAYFVVVARALRFPYAITCGCFGRLGLGWITRQTLMRNAMLLALALITWVDSWRAVGVWERLHDLGSDWWWLAGVTLAVVTTGLVVREGKPPLTASPTEGRDGYIARLIPYVVLDGPEGPGSVWRLSDEVARLLVFYAQEDPGAGEVFARLPVWQEQLAPARVHLVSQAEWSALALEHPDIGDWLLGDPDGQTGLRLGVRALPGAVLLGADRYFAGGPVEGLQEIEELVEAAAEAIEASLGEPESGPAPSSEEARPAAQ